MTDSQTWNPPNPDEIEVSLFGPGYGECVVVHVGAGDWVVVDSCVAGRGRSSIALEYFAKIGVDPAAQVKAIVATHWHDDHVRGLAGLVQASPNARFACSAAFQQQEFLTLTEATRTDPLIASSSGVDEFREILSTVPHPVFTLCDKTLFVRDTPSVAVLALSPSDKAFQATMEGIARLLPDALSPKRRIVPEGPNHSSIALWIQVESTHLLLGADLEEQSGNHWSSVLASTIRPQEKADIFKVPHHGSQNAHHSDVWTTMVVRDAVALVSPFQLGNVSLPTPGDIVRICSYTTNAYITSDIARKKASLSNRTVQKTINSVVNRITVANSPLGHVRARRTIAEHGPWDIVAIDPARKLSDAA